MQDKSSYLNYNQGQNIRNQHGSQILNVENTDLTNNNTFESRAKSPDVTQKTEKTYKNSP